MHNFPIDKYGCVEIIAIDDYSLATKLVPLSSIGLVMRDIRNHS